PTDPDPGEPTEAPGEEVAYLFVLSDDVFATLRVERDQIVYRFSGSRPLPRHEDTAPGFVSRDDRVEVDSSRTTPVVSLVGGKWTTFRALGETLSTRVLELLGRARTTSTTDRPIGGGRGFPTSDSERED